MNQLTHHSSLIAFASTWNDVCGIATYSRSLVAYLEKNAEVDAVSLDCENRAQLDKLAAQMNACDLIHIQHQYPFFGGMAIHRNRFRKLLSKLRKPLVVTIHELDLGESDGWPLNMYKPWFNHHLFGAQEIGRLIVHTKQHQDALTTLGIEPESGRVLQIAYRGTDLTGAPGDMVLIHSDFRPVGQLILPFASTTTFNGQPSMTVKIEKVAVNVPVDEKLFAKQ